MTHAPLRAIPCTICGAESVARKLCRPCYQRQKRRGLLGGYRKLTAEDVFETKFQKTRGCWEWLGNRNQYGYGIFMLPNEVRVRAHRYAYERYVGPIIDDMVVMHSCDNPACVNPAHLSLGGRGDNNRDAVAKKRNAFGEKNGHHVLTQKQVGQILSDTRPQIAIARDFGVHPSLISRIKSGLRRSKG